MSDFTTEKNKLISPEQVKALTAIYDDYLYMVREYEQWLLLSPIGKLAEDQKAQMYPEGYAFPWEIKPLNINEQKEFADYIKNNAQGKDNHSYINLWHTDTKEDNGNAPTLTIPPYTSTKVNQIMPSKFERYTISYPKDATLADTEFYIDGRYKAVYTGENGKNKLLDECLYSQDFSTEFTVMLNIGECLRKNGYIENAQFENMKTEVYTEEKTKASENNLLEIIGSFGERVKDICNEIYDDKDANKNNQNDSKYNVMKAQREGFMKLPKNIWDYVNLRNFIRHQWETLDGWEDYMPKTFKDSKEKHSERVKAYFNFCDMPFYVRMKNYIKVLHQMQKVIAEINPNRMVRHKSVSDRKFKKRLEIRHQQEPNQIIEAEINYQQFSDKFELYKGEISNISPNIRIVDDNYESDDKYERMFERMEAYKLRSWFLQTFHSLESFAIGLCITRGKNSVIGKDNKEKNLNIRDAWDYLRDTGIITRDECTQWQYYTKMRRKISHYYFDEGLKEQLDNKEKQFFRDLTFMNNKLYKAAPDITRREDGMCEYTHPDGKFTVLDPNRHLILEGKEEAAQPSKAPEKFKFADKPFADKAYKPNSDKRKPRKVYPNGIEIEDDGQKITGIRFPNDVFVNMENQSIHWGKDVHWYGNAQFFNALKINNHTVQTNKKLRVTEYRIGKKEQDFDYGDHLHIDKHHVVIDDNGFLKKFDFKDAQDNIIQAKFRRTDDGQNIVLFEDNTGVVFSDKNVSVIHNNQVLSLNNLDNFVATYGPTPLLSQNISKRGQGR